MTWFRCSGAGIPAALKSQMNDVLNKKFGTSIDYPPEGWPDDVNLLGPLPEGTATGPIASISDGADRVPIKSWIVNIDPNLTGNSAIECIQDGINLFNEDWEVGGLNDTTGLPNSDTNKIRSKTFSNIKGGVTIYIKAPQPIRLLFYKADETFISETSNIRNNTFTVPSDAALFKIRGTVDYGTTYNDDISINYPSTYTDYHSHVAPTVSTVNLGQTIYGGSADVVNGTGVHSHNGLTVYASDNWQTGYYGAGYRYYINGLSEMKSGQNCLNDLNISGVRFTIDNSKRINAYCETSTGFDTVDKFKETLGTGVRLCYELETPIDITFDPITPTPQTPESHSANFWADTGDSTVGYRRDIDLALQAVSNSRFMMIRPGLEQTSIDQGSEESKENNIETEGEQDAR